MAGEQQETKQKSPEFVLVKSTHQGILHIGAGDERHEMTLMPGVNKVSAEAWEKALESLKTRPALKHYFDEGILEALRGEKPAEFGKLSVSKAMKLVKDTNVEELLKEFRQSEQRPEVLEAIEKKIKTLQPSDKGE